ncbi:MAG: indolepyruvate oxidoreductase subunit beta family protein [Thermoleophilia bacterium]|nr:indolepyruvate oxidoreductase subunit beta family protein [Thermoleophilia bacterium]
MTGTLPTTSAAPAAGLRSDDLVVQRSHAAIRPWSALVCGLPDDRTLLLVDWIVLACRAAGMVASAVPVAAGDDSPHGMYIEVAPSEEVEEHLGDLPWGAVDLVVAGEHLELMRAIDAGFVSPDLTTVVASCRRSFTHAERVAAPQHVLTEREIDAIATASSLAYHAFDGPEVAQWYRLPSTAQPGLLLGAVCGTGVTGLDEATFRTAIAELGLDARLHVEGFRRGVRLGRRSGGRIRRVRTAYQFTRKRRAAIDNGSRAGFEQLVTRAAEVVHPDHLNALQDAIFLLCEFQDAAWARQLVDHVEEVVRVESAQGIDPASSIVPDVIRSLASLLVWSDAAWVANRKLRSARLKGIRAAHGISRHDAFELVEHIPLDAHDRRASQHPRLRSGTLDPAAPALLQPFRVERLRTTSVSGARRLRKLARSAQFRAGSPRQQREVETVQAWLEALHDSLRADHQLACIVASSGTLVQGGGAVRDANRATAIAFWGRIVRQTLAMDRGNPAGEPDVARHVIPFAWEQLCRSGPLALWEYAAQVLAIGLAQSRGLAYDDVVRMADTLCRPHRPVTGR